MSENEALAKREGALAKAMSMARLFNHGPFEDITEILNQIDPADIDAKYNEFKTACGNLLDTDEKAWLWNYLKHYNKGLADKTDAKWHVSSFNWL